LLWYHVAVVIVVEEGVDVDAAQEEEVVRVDVQSSDSLVEEDTMEIEMALVVTEIVALITLITLITLLIGIEEIETDHTAPWIGTTPQKALRIG